VSIKVRARIHPFKDEYVDFYREAAPLKDIYAGLNPPLDITHARFLINDEMIMDTDLAPPDGSTVYINVVAAGTGSQTKDTGKGMFWGGVGLTVLGIVATVFTWGAGIGLGAMLIGSGVGMMAGGVALINTEIPTSSARENGNQMESLRVPKTSRVNWVTFPFYSAGILSRRMWPHYPIPKLTQTDGNGSLSYSVRATTI
jgi:hypothetical protein